MVALWASDAVFWVGVFCYIFLFYGFNFRMFCAGVQTVVAYEFESFGWDVLYDSCDEFFYGECECVCFFLIAEDGYVVTVVVGDSFVGDWWVSNVACYVADEFFFGDFCFDDFDVESFVVSVVAEFLK